ncbi:MAG: DNA translocase FtsK 4TM domain-containing protein, partial [Lachnospiraceae bacterium]|nr:DNA translocase FtsK 4TM domain-containing protein [Lachnospiraceae bacterium]
MASTKGDTRTQNTSKSKKTGNAASGSSSRGSSATSGKSSAASGSRSAGSRSKSGAKSSSRTSSSRKYQEDDREREYSSYAGEEELRQESEGGLFPFFREICALLSFGFCTLMFLGVLGFGGKAGEILALVSHALIGTIVSFVLPFILLAVLVYIIYRWYERTTWIRISGMALVLVCLSTLFQVIVTKKEELAALDYFEGISSTPGGFIGVLGTHLLMFLCGKPGAIVIILILMLIGVILMTGLSIPGLFSFLLESARERREDEVDRREEQRRRASLREQAASERKNSADRDSRDSRDYWESRREQNSAQSTRTSSRSQSRDHGNENKENAGSPIQGYPREMFASPEEEAPKKKKKGAVQKEEQPDTSGLNIFGLDSGNPDINEARREEKKEEKPQVGYGLGASFKKEEPAQTDTDATGEFPDQSMFKKPEEASKRPGYGTTGSRVSHPSYQEPSTKDPSAVEVAMDDGGIVVMSKQTTAAARRMSYEGPIFNEMEAFVQDMGKTDPDVPPPPPIRPQLKPRRDNRTLSELSKLDNERGVDGSGYEYGETASDAFARRHSISGKTPVESS